MNATKTAKTATAAATAERNAPELADFADLAAAALTAYRAANPAPAAPARRSAAAPGTMVGEKHACRCGYFAVADGNETSCGKAQTWRLFAPGHDAKLKGMLIRAAVAGELVADAATGETAPALAWADRFGFGHQVRAGVALAEIKAKAKAQAAAEREAARATARAAKTTPAAPAPAPAEETPAPAADEATPAAPAAPEDLFADLLAEVVAEDAPAAPAKAARKPRARKA